MLDGKALSSQYCVSCHQYPDPALLDKKTWKDYILPRMGYMYGIYDSDSIRDELLEDNLGGEIVERRNIFPKEQMIDSAEWLAIVDYYLNSAPEELKVNEPYKLSFDLEERFELKKPQLELRPPSTTLLKAIDGHILLGDANKKALFLIDEKLQTLNAAMLKEGPVHIEEMDGYYWVTLMGSFSPSDEPQGMIVRLDTKGKEPIQRVAQKLQRPVHAAYSDFNKDGKVDIAICEFGKWTGALSIWSQNEKGQFIRKDIIKESGAIKVYARDLNEDGRMDLIALFGQANESIRAFINEGDLNFREEMLIQFPPSYGSSFFQLDDIDDDGDEDIVYCAGDNADYLPILKPYHGIYIFSNENGKYSESEFIHMDGAYAASVKDFDGDGDKDIAAISFFPDWRRKVPQSFIFFENEGTEYRPGSFEEPKLGRWIIMEVADLDRDDDLDILIGGLAFETVPQTDYVKDWVKKGTPFLLLENKSN